MNNSLRPETSTRDTEKCSFCRQRRKKCSPHGRDWENSQQKCDFCEAHDLSCGPNLRYREDPAVIRRRAEAPENANAAGGNQARERHPEGSPARSAPNNPLPTGQRVKERDDGPPNASGVEDGKESDTPSIECLERKAFSKLDEFKASGYYLAYMSQTTFFHCPGHDATNAEQTYHDLSIEEKLHDLFINIYGTVVEANARNEPRVARSILFGLLSALDRNPQLFDKRKRHILLKMALMFQELGHQWDCEYVLLKIAGMFKMTALPPQEGPYHLLANSLPISSISTKRVLEDRWNETVGGSHPDSNLTVPPLHAAVQHRNSNIILALLSNSNSSPLTPSRTTSSNVGQVTANIDERDLNGRTALFAAVANGEESCCFALLLNGADANTRDDHGRTALEVAVRGGHLSIVKNLIEYNAHVNPDIIGCSSLPLHAAIESNNPQREIINHLLNGGAEVNLRRYVDNKHAIDLAVDREYHDLAQSMRRMIPSLSNTPFMLRDSSMGQIIS